MLLKTLGLVGDTPNALLVLLVSSTNTDAEDADRAPASQATRHIALLALLVGKSVLYWYKSTGTDAKRRC